MIHLSPRLPGRAPGDVRPSMKLFAVCAPGLEPFLTQEIKALGLFPLATQTDAGEEGGGVEFEGELTDLYRANLWLRTASRVLARLGEFPAVGFPELRRKAHNLPWERYLNSGESVTIRVTSHASKLYMKRVIARHVAEGITERLGKPVRLSHAAEHREESPQTQETLHPSSAAHMNSAQSDTPLIVVRLLNDVCTISVDSSGEHLYRRGYKLAVAKAPLRETLAAGMLLAAGWEGKSALLDPFCGSGTIPIEAALLGLAIPPGVMRSFRFQAWPGYDPNRWQELLRTAESHRQTTLAPIFASDRDAGAIQMSIANAERAGVAEFIQFSQRAVSSIELQFAEPQFARPPQGPGWVVTNPPYGVRVSQGKDLRNLYAQLGKVLRVKCPGWRVAMLGTDDRLFSATGLTWEPGISLVNGGIQVRLALGQVTGF